jgi:hypothetical protein
MESQKNFARSLLARKKRKTGSIASDLRVGRGLKQKAGLCRSGSLALRRTAGRARAETISTCDLSL